MAKKYIHKALSVGLSLALCAGLVLPSFAASFNDLNNAIQNTGSWEKDAFDISDGEDGRKITLKEEVTWQTGDGKGHIEIDSNDKIVLDLNGQTITSRGDKTNDPASTIWVNGGKLTLEDSSAEKQTDENGNETYVPGTGTGKITGGAQCGVVVEGNGSFTMKAGNIEGNKNIGKFGHMGDGVCVNGGTFEMLGGQISGNGTEDKAGNSVYVQNGKFTMKDGILKDKVTVEGDAGKVDIQGGRVSSLDDKYLNGKGLIDNPDGTNTVVVHSAENHSWGAWGAWTNNDDGTRTHTRTCLVHGCDETDSATENIPATTPVTPTTPDAPVIDETVEIDDPAVPLAAGPVTRGEFIDYLWRHEGEPEAAAPTYTDVSADYEYAPAIGWAQSIGILDRVVSEDSFDPDELVTVAAVRDILADFAQYAGMEMPELTTLAGEDDEAVLNCDEILAQFFGEELAA